MHIGTCNSVNMRLMLAELRKIRDISQEELAELSGLHRSTIARIEIQNVGWTHQTLETLADALQCEIWELFGYSHPPDIVLTENHRKLLSLACTVNESAAKLLIAQCGAMVSEGMVFNPNEAQDAGSRRRPGRPKKTKKKPAK